MRLRTLVLPAFVLLQACASVEERRLVPVMGMSEGEDEQQAGSASARLASPAGTEVAAVDSASALAQSLVFLPFRDVSSFKGEWNTHLEFPRAVADSLRHSRFVHSMAVDSAWARLAKRERGGEISLERGLSLGRELGADCVVFGEIQELGMKRFHAGVPVAGYRSYESQATVRVHLVNAFDGEPAGDVTVGRTEDTKRYGITNPVAYVPFEKEYFLLGQFEWGGEEFRESLTGKAIQACITGLAVAVDSMARPPELQVLEPKIVDVVDSLRAYINVGSVDAVQNGRKYGVWDQGRALTDPDTGVILGRSLPRRVGVVQVEQVLAEHLSLVRILEGHDQVQLGYGIRAE